MLVIFAIMIVGITLFAQSSNSKTNLDDFLFEDSGKQDQLFKETAPEDVIRIEYEKKDARKAMVFSLLIPGAGQFYADRSAITTYIFPLLEIGLLGGILYYNSKGASKTDEYESYANKEIVTLEIGGYLYTGPRYNREYQNITQNALSGFNSSESYTYRPDFFRLEDTNSQHFYEDIGKYNKYIFGWADWYHTFAADSDGSFLLNDINYWDITDGLPNEIQWQGNYVISDYVAGSTNNQSISPNSPMASPMRRQYIKMRQDAEVEYSIARAFGFGLALNHLISGLDALRVTNKRNRYYLSDSGMRFHYYANVDNGNFTPMLALSYRF